MRPLRSALVSILGFAAASGSTAETLEPPRGVDIPLPAVGNGGLTLYAYDETASVTVYLGLDLDDFSIEAASPSGGRRISFGKMPGWTEAFGDDVSEVRWHVTAADQTNATHGISHLGRRVATTVRAGALAPLQNAFVTNATSNVDEFTRLINDDRSCPNGSPCVATRRSDVPWAGRLADKLYQSIATIPAPALPFGNVSRVSTPTEDNSMEFYVHSGGGGGTLREPAASDRYENAAGPGLWDLTADGVLTWTQPNVSTR